MRNLKLVSMVLGLMLGVAALSHAGGLTKPRKAYVHSYSASIGLINAGPGALYQVVLSSGAANEYVVFVDSNSATGLVQTQTTKLLTPRLFYQTTSSNTVVTFDPPLLYTNGLVIMPSAVTGQASATYESGRGLGGN